MSNFSKHSPYPRNPAAGKSLQYALQKATKAAFKKRPAAEQSLLLHWPEIAGKEWATRMTPTKIAGGRSSNRFTTLHVDVDAAFALEAQYMEPVLLEKITAYLGYSAVQRITLHQRHT